MLSLFNPLSLVASPLWPAFYAPLVTPVVKEIVGKLNYHYDVKLPNFTKDQVSVTTSDGYLDLTAKNDKETVQLSWYVGPAGNTANTRARLENGKLRLSVPKRELSKPQKIVLE